MIKMNTMPVATPAKKTYKIVLMSHDCCSLLFCFCVLSARSAAFNRDCIVSMRCS